MCMKLKGREGLKKRGKHAHFFLYPYQLKGESELFRFRISLESFKENATGKFLIKVRMFF